MDKLQREMQTNFLRHRLALRVMPTPIGSNAYFDTDGALACSLSAQKTGTATFISAVAPLDPQAVSEGSNSPLSFQLQIGAGS